MCFPSPIPSSPGSAFLLVWKQLVAPERNPAAQTPRASQGASSHWLPVRFPSVQGWEFRSHKGSQEKQGMCVFNRCLFRLCKETRLRLCFPCVSPLFPALLDVPTPPYPKPPTVRGICPAGEVPALLCPKYELGYDPFIDGSGEGRKSSAPGAPWRGRRGLGAGLALGTGGGRCWKRYPCSGQGKAPGTGQEEEEEGRRPEGAQDRCNGGGQRLVSEMGTGGGVM